MSEKKKETEELDLDLGDLEEILELTDVVEVGPKYKREEVQLEAQELRQEKEPALELEEIRLGEEEVEEDLEIRPPELGVSPEPETQMELKEIETPIQEEKEEPLFVIKEDIPLLKEELPVKEELTPETALRPMDQAALEEMIRDTVEKAVTKATKEVMLEVAERVIREAIEDLRKAIKEA